MKFEAFCNKVLIVGAGIVLAFLTFMSFIYTQRVGQAEKNEILNNAPIYNEPDNLLFHIIAICIVVGICLLFGKIKTNIKYIGAGTALLAFALSVAILLGGMRTPVDDQIQVCSAASLFNQGIYTNMEKGGYINIYPHQLGLVLLYQGIFSLFGNLNYRAIQFLNCIFIAGAVFIFFLCLQEFTKSCLAKVLSSFLLLATLPLYLLSSWAYGDIPSFFFTALFIYGFIKYMKYNQKKWIPFMLVSIFIAVIIRKNVIIMALAAVVILLIHFLCNKKAIYLVTAIMILILPMLGIKGIQQYYENKGGYVVDGGIPSVMYIAMGMMDAGSKPGWFSNYHVSTYYSVECDRELAKEKAMEEIQLRVNSFLKEPITAVSFYKRKICTQWNDPYYNTERLIKIDNMDDIAGVSAFLFRHGDGARVWLSVIQMLTYMGALLYCINVASGRKLYENISLVILFGGFLFSILWEANSRYVFFFVLFLIPIAVIGWEDCTMKINRLVKK